MFNTCQPTRQGIISKANQILQSGHVFEGPLKGTTHWFSVGSFSAERPHQVAVKGVAGEVSCDREGWRAQKCCAHAVAVSQQKGMLTKYLDWCASKNQHCQHECQKASTWTKSQGQATKGSEK